MNRWPADRGAARVVYAETGACAICSEHAELRPAGLRGAWICHRCASTTTKACTMCSRKLPLTGFYRNVGGPHSYCKACFRNRRDVLRGARVPEVVVPEAGCLLADVWKR